MRVLLYIAFILSCIPQGIQAQNEVYFDSVNQQLTLPMFDTTKVNLLNKIAEDLFYIDQDKIMEYALLALELSEEINYKTGIAQAYNNMGIYYRSKGIFNEAIDYFFKALEIMEKEQNQKGIARSYNFIGILYYYLDNYDLSLEYYTKALKLNQEQHDMKWIAGNSNNIGMIYEQTGKHNEALKFYMKSLEMNISLGNKNWISNNYGNIGSLYLKMNNPLSLEYLERRLEITLEQGNPAGNFRSYHLIGGYYLKYGEYEKAIQYFKAGFEIAKAINSLSSLQKITEDLCTVFDSLEWHDSAFIYHKIFKTYNDSLNLSENTQKITRLRMQYQYNKKNQLKELNYEKSRFRQSLTAIGLVFILLIIILLYGRKRSRVKQQNLKQKQLEIDNKALKEELSFKENLLQDNIKYLLQKNDLITVVLEDLENIKTLCSKDNISIIDDVIRDLKIGAQDDTWNEFELRFNQIHSDFYEKLNSLFPNLSANEKKLCAFLKLDMSTKEIASMTQQSIKSIETARTRLRKKLNISDGSKTLLDFFKKI